MTTGADFVKKEKCGYNQCSTMSITAWCDLHSKADTLKLHEICPSWSSQKIITFTPRQFQFEGISIKNDYKSIFRGKKAWDGFIKPSSEMATPLISAAVAAKTKNPQSAQITGNNLKSITGGKILSPTDMHGRGWRIKVMYIISNKIR